MTDLDFDSPDLQLLTDALRAGPGTPQWRAALDRLGPATGDEYHHLYEARERLASGRRYREVRAGAGFTHRVFEQIEREEAGKGAAKPLPSANLIALVSALAILAILAVVAYFIIPRAATAPTQADTYFVTTLASANFERDLGLDFQPFGPLSIESRRGLRPVTRDVESTFRGGGVVFNRTLMPDEPFAFDVTLRLPKLDDNVAVQVFVTDEPNFTGDSATSEHELVWTATNGAASIVLPGGRVDAQNLKIPQRTSVTLRLTVNHGDSTIQLNSQPIWSGPNLLDPAKPRTLGIRFLGRKGLDERERPVIETARVLVPQRTP